MGCNVGHGAPHLCLACAALRIPESSSGKQILGADTSPADNNPPIFPGCSTWPWGGTGPLDLYPVTGIAGVWGECPAPPDPQPPRCPPGEGRPACSSRSHSQFPGLQDRVVATTPTCDASISRGGRGASHESSCGRDLSPWGLSPSDPRRRRSPGCRQLCAWGHAQLPEKRPHLLGPPECLSMKGLRPGPWPISEWAWAPRGPRGPPVWLPQDTDPRWTLKPPFQREKRPAQDPGDGGEEAQAPSWGEDGC
uniref:MAPK-interacting and spindle-stabilizing protein-like n=1 Tax=Nyctereutes procyonoides TaxID=34880 RepID=UPI00244536A5|nr:MAPK-interacting and spindle-stabilizing protein-like [Nyctereutes procyonoides]